MLDAKSFTHEDIHQINNWQSNVGLARAMIAAMALIAGVIARHD